MIFAFFVFGMTDSLSVDEIAVGIWSGYECVVPRLIPAVKTWIRQFPTVYIYSDFFPKNATERLRSAAGSTRLQFIAFGNCAKHLWFPSAWKRAQPRFLKGMVDLFIREPTKKWYLFADDDSYVFAKNTKRILGGFNFSRKIVVGHFYCAWPAVVFGKNHNMKCMNFPQGGAGVAISHGMLAFLADKLPECNAKYNEGEYAGSMRFGKCITDYVNDGTWRHGDGIQNFKSQFMSRSPIEEIEDSYCNRPPATFHGISRAQVRFVYRGHYSRWVSQNGTEYEVDWSHLTARPFLLFPEERQPLHLRFGYGIALPDNNRVIARATSPILPELVNEIPFAYEQHFGEALRVRIICDQEAGDTVEQDSFENREWMQFNVRVTCPVPHRR
jgi:hypothetical protein